MVTRLKKSNFTKDEILEFGEYRQQYILFKKHYSGTINISRILGFIF